jgi:hypothetical protein
VFCVMMSVQYGGFDGVVGCAYASVSTGNDFMICTKVQRMLDDESSDHTIPVLILEAKQEEI